MAVGIGQLAVSKNPSDTLVAYGLGSCVGATLFDRASGIAGMVHVLLPKSDGRRPSTEPARFADEGIDTLLAQMKAAGANPRNLVVKLAGGAAVLGALERREVQDRRTQR